MQSTNMNTLATHRTKSTAASVASNDDIATTDIVSDCQVSVEANRIAEPRNINLIDNLRDMELLTDTATNTINSFMTNNRMVATIADSDQASRSRSDISGQLKDTKTSTVIIESENLVPTDVHQTLAHKLLETSTSRLDRKKRSQQSTVNNICDTDLNDDKSIDHISKSSNQQPLKDPSNKSTYSTELTTRYPLESKTAGELIISENIDSDNQTHQESVEYEQLTNDLEHTSDESSVFNINHQTFQLDEQSISERSYSPSYLKRFRHTRTKGLLGTLRQISHSTTLGWFSTNSSKLSDNTISSHLNSEDKDLLTGASKYSNLKKRKQNISGRTFWGSYRYRRIGIVMALLKKLFSFITSRSTLALFGAFLIHITLGTVYTLSNINSYLTSYMRKHGTPNATYGGSMWISSSYAIGQGFSMVLGGYIAKRFSARLSCILGCILHSGSIMSTSVSIDYGHIPVLITYGLLPGFGCGLAYMTPMTNGFGWFPNRKGLVAGTILAGFGIGTFVFNMAQTAYVNPENLSPPKEANGYFTQESVLQNVPHLFTFIGTIYASMQFIGCCLLFKPPNDYYSTSTRINDEKPILVEAEMPLRKAIRSREFLTLFFVFGLTNQGVLFVNSMLKEYGQIFIGNDMYLAWTGSMASIANSLGRLVWGMAIDRYSFSRCFTAITCIFGLLMFIMPFKFVLSSKLLYLLCTLGIFGSFSGWMSTYPVHISRVFGVQNSGMVYGLIFVSQALLAIFTALGAHYLIDHYSRFVPFFCVTFLEVLGLLIYHLFYEKRSWN